MARPEPLRKVFDKDSHCHEALRATAGTNAVQRNTAPDRTGHQKIRGGVSPALSDYGSPGTLPLMGRDP